MDLASIHIRISGCRGLSMFLTHYVKILTQIGIPDLEKAVMESAPRLE